MKNPVNYQTTNLQIKENTEFLNKKNFDLSNNQTKNPTRHYVYIDFLRIIAILSVIALHCFSQFFVDINLYGTKTWWAINILNSVSRFGVPIFFMISGHLLLTRYEGEIKISSFLKKRLLKILIPLAAWSLIYYLYYGISPGKNMSVPDFLSNFISSNIAYHLWFLYTLIFLYLIIPVFQPFIAKASPKQIFYLLIVSILPVTIFPFINKISGIWLFRFDSVINGYFGYMILGVLLGKVDTLKVKQRILIYLGGIAGILMAVFGTVYYSNSSAIDAFFNGGYQINSFLIAAAIFVFVRELFKRIENNKNSKSTASFLTAISFLGKCSFGVYLIHVLILELLCKYISYPSLPIQIICNFLICSAISFAGSALISKIPVLNKILLF